MNFMERLKWAFKPPMRPRHPLAGRAFWQGAQASRLEADWRSIILSADREVEADVIVLRGRARDLTKNNPYASRFLDLLDTYVIGPDGIRLSPEVRKADGELDTETNQKIIDGWKKWGKNVTLDRKKNWHEVTQTSIRMVAQDGEVFLKKINTKDGFKIQVIESDFLDVTLNSSRNQVAGIKIAQGNKIIQGIEVNSDGVPQWYHFWKSHPAGLTGAQRASGRTRQRVRAKDVIHFMKVKNRVDQTRGITWLSPAMWPLKMLDGLQQGELVAARTSANKMGFIETGPTDTVPYKDYPDDDITGEEVQESMEAVPGLIERLPHGSKFVAWNPDHPSTAFEPFVRVILQAVSVALNVSYAALAGDPNKESFSSARIHSQLERDHWRCLQSWMAEKIHQVCYEGWITNAVLSGELKLSSKVASDFFDVRWVARQFEMIDAVKDTVGIENQIKLGLTTRTKEAASRGSDYRRNIMVQAEEEAFAKEHGVTLGGVVPPPEPVTLPET